MSGAGQGPVPRDIRDLWAGLADPDSDLWARIIEPDGMLPCARCGRPEREWRWTCRLLMWLLARVERTRGPGADS